MKLQQHQFDQKLKTEPIDLHTRVNEWIKEHDIFKETVGINDVNILIETARELPLDIEY